MDGSTYGVFQRQGDGMRHRNALNRICVYTGDDADVDWNARDVDGRPMNTLMMVPAGLGAPVYIRGWEKKRYTVHSIWTTSRGMFYGLVPEGEVMSGVFQVDRDPVTGVWFNVVVSDDVVWDRSRWRDGRLGELGV